MRGQRPRPLDDGAVLAEALLDTKVGGEVKALGAPKRGFLTKIEDSQGLRLRFEVFRRDTFIESPRKKAKMPLSSAY